MKLSKIELETVEYLRTPAAIRQKCDRLFNLAVEDKLRYFRVDLTQLDKAANYAIETTREQYPDFNIPFTVAGGILKSETCRVSPNLTQL